MSKLVTESTMKMLQEYDEATLNGRFSPFAFYQTVLLSSARLDHRIQDIDHKNTLYRRLYQALENGDVLKARKIMNRIKITIDEDRGLINKYLEVQKEEEENIDDTIMQAWDKNTIGYLSWFETED